MSTDINIGKKIAILDEGSSITTDVSQINFTGSGVTATTSGNNVTVNVTGLPSVQNITSAFNVTPTASDDLVKVTSQASSLNFVNPTGAWSEGQSLMIRIKDNGTARAITFDTNYRAIGVTLPTTTVINKTTYLGIIYNQTDGKWDAIGVTTEA